MSTSGRTRSGLDAEALGEPFEGSAYRLVRRRDGLVFGSDRPVSMVWLWRERAEMRDVSLAEGQGEPSR